MSEKKGLFQLIREYNAKRAKISESPGTTMGDVVSNVPPTSIHLKDIKSLRRQRNLMGSGIVMLVISVAALSLTIAARQEKVILVPGILAQYDLGGRHLPIKYLEDMALQVGTVFFNRHPDDNDYYEQNAFRLSHVSFHDALKKMIEEERQNRFSSGSSQIFRVHRMNTIPDDLTVELHGVRETISGDKVIKKEAKIYSIVFVRNGWELKLNNIFDIDQKASIVKNSNSKAITEGDKP